MKLKKLKDNKIIEVHSVVEVNDKYEVQYSPNGKIYSFYKSNIELINDHYEANQLLEEKELYVYTYDTTCWKCKNTTSILTYILDKKGTQLTFPWDKNNLNKLKSLDEELMHMEHPEIEFYPILIMGSNEYLDKLMMGKFSPKIKKAWSNMQKRTYPMNHCECGAHQGEFFVYEKINKIIQQLIDIPVVDKIILPDNFKFIANIDHSE